MLVVGVGGHKGRRDTPTGCYGSTFCVRQGVPLFFALSSVGDKDRHDVLVFVVDRPPLSRVNHPTAALSTSSISAITNNGAGWFSLDALPSCFSAIVKREIEPLRSPISGGVCPEGVVASTA